MLHDNCKIFKPFSDFDLMCRIDFRDLNKSPFEKLCIEVKRLREIIDDLPKKRKRIKK